MIRTTTHYWRVHGVALGGTGHPRNLIGHPRCQSIIQNYDWLSSQSEMGLRFKSLTSRSDFQCQWQVAVGDVRQLDTGRDVQQETCQLYLQKLDSIYFSIGHLGRLSYYLAYLEKGFIIIYLCRLRQRYKDEGLSASPSHQGMYAFALFKTLSALTMDEVVSLLLYLYTVAYTVIQCIVQFLLIQM